MLNKRFILLSDGGRIHQGPNLHNHFLSFAIPICREKAVEGAENRRSVARQDLFPRFKLERSEESAEQKDDLQIMAIRAPSCEQRNPPRT